jgi:hypothetical protein
MAPAAQWGLGRASSAVADFLLLDRGGGNYEVAPGGPGILLLDTDGGGHKTKHGADEVADFLLLYRSG